MTTVHAVAPQVQPSRATIAIVGLPEVLADEVEPFISPEDTIDHTPVDEAWWAGFNAALDGSPGWLPTGPGWTRERSFGFLRGGHAGTEARVLKETRELGVELGKLGGPTEPPPGFTAREGTAYREGYAEGERAELAEIEHDAYLDSVMADAAEAMFGDEGRITDRDVYPMGCVS